MLELLILYSLNKQELTLYGLKKFISEHFGEISKPSHGALHPALKRLMNINLVEVRSKMSGGGKRYTYYSVAKNFADFFDEKFLQFNSSKTETLEAFLYELKCRLFVSDLLSSDCTLKFKELVLLKLNYYEEQVKSKLSNQYLELNDLQKKISEKYLSEIDGYKKLMEGEF